MLKVIPLFSVLNDDLKIENGRLFPVLYTDFATSANLSIMQAPFFIVFTDKNE